MSLLLPLTVAAGLGRLLVPAAAPVELLLGGLVAALSTAWVAAVHGRSVLVPLAVAAGLAAAATSRCSLPVVDAAHGDPDATAVGRIRSVRFADGETSAVVEPLAGSFAGTGAGTLAGPVRLRIRGRPQLTPGDVVLLPPRAAGAAFAGSAPGRDPFPPAVSLGPDEVVPTARAADARTAEWTTQVRRHLVRALEARAAPAAAMTRSLALGEEWRLDAPARAVFREIGVSHLLAISGFNLALVAWVLWRSFLALGGLVHGLPLRVDLRRAAAALVLPPIWCLAAVVGWQPSVVRAALMVTALLVARLLWRRAPALDGLAFAVLLLLVAAPDLAGTPGFQLSLAAVGGLLAADRFSVFGRVRKDHPASLPFRHRRPARAVPSAGPGTTSAVADRLAAVAASAGRLVLVGFGAATFAALATAPIGAWHFSKVALAAPLANLIAIPLFTFVVYPAAMLATLLAAGPAPDGLVEAAASLAQASWELFVRSCEGLARTLPGSIATGPDGACGVTVVSLALVLLLCRWRGARRAALVVLAVVAVSAADPPAAARPADGPPPVPRGAAELVFLDVGDADATLLLLPDGRRALIDGGNGPTARAGRRSRSVLEELRQRGVRSLDLVIATHAHPDHSGGLLELSAEVAIRELWTNPQAEAEGPERPFARWLRALERTGTVVRRTPAVCGPQRFGGVTLDVLSPCGSRGFDVALDENDNSLVVRLSLGAADVLFMGDAGRATEQSLLDRGVAVEAEALKVAHHGSRSASGVAFLARAAPAAAIVSAATHRADHRGPPHAEVLERLARSRALVLQTGETGAITLHVTEHELRAFDASGRLRGAWATTGEAVARARTISP